jgi:thiol-disulfide isomerase/thioredoxin
LDFLWTPPGTGSTLDLKMKTIPFTTSLCAVIMALHGSAFAGGEGWSSDYAGSKKLAAESKKDLLIDFTGSDWCGWCIKLNDEVFKHEEFKTGVKDNFVLVELDFPKDKSKLSAEVQAQNDELSDQYGVQGFPTILLTDAQGRPYASTGYQRGGPAAYVTHLNELRARKGQRDEAFESAQSLEGVAKAKAFIDALDAMELEETMITNFYGDIVEKIKEADPKDETGFGKKAAAKERLDKFQKTLQEFAAKEDMDGALAHVNETLKQGGFGTEETLQMMMTKAVIFAQQQKFDEALKAVDEAKAYAPDSPMAPGIDGFRKRIEESMKQAAEAAGDAPAEAPAEEAEEAKEQE